MNCRNCKDPITRCPDHAPVIFGQCGGWRHAYPRLHLCYPGDNRNPRIAEPETMPSDEKR